MTERCGCGHTLQPDGEGGMACVMGCTYQAERDSNESDGEDVIRCSFCGSPDWATRTTDGDAHCSRDECAAPFSGSTSEREAGWRLAREVHALRLVAEGRGGG